MLILPVALAVGALGLLARGRRRVVLTLAVAAPILSVLALAAQYLPSGLESCTASTSGPMVCRSLPAVYAWAGPVPYLIAIGLIVLSLAPLASARVGKWWPAAASALLQAIPQVISFGGFIDWAPALAVTIAVAFALIGPRTAGQPTPAASPNR
ncbi:MAG: hypothetical protein E6I30_05815 [Chloroflexi bacterium]|nr:MAG: hypothetical protein E6I30_05815 [Chloroflexota bacterium]TMG60061.1 MAG: hypothetical protein E6H83_06220 [Chloroflexota bacterium]